MNNENETGEPSGASGGSRLATITVPLGDGLVGIAYTRDNSGVGGVLMRPLIDQHAIGDMAKGAYDFGVFIRCPKKESAEVLLRHVQQLVDSFKE